jgi:hypothetical protein
MNKSPHRQWEGIEWRQAQPFDDHTNREGLGLTACKLQARLWQSEYTEYETYTAGPWYACFTKSLTDSLVACELGIVAVDGGQEAHTQCKQPTHRGTKWGPGRMEGGAWWKKGTVQGQRKEEQPRDGWAHGLASSRDKADGEGPHHVSSSSTSKLRLGR